MSLDAATLEQIRRDLTRDRDDILRTLGELGPRGDAPLVEMLTASLEELRHALHKLEEGRFGRCESCAGELELRRVSQLPTIRLCRSCDEQRLPQG